jgi:hypothetical protein
MNSHEDTKRDRHNVANNLVKTQHDLENESATRANLEATAQSLREKLKFDADVHQKVCINSTYSFVPITGVATKHLGISNITEQIFIYGLIPTAITSKFHGGSQVQLSTVQ